MTDEHLQARVQRIEADVHGLYRVLSLLDGDKVRKIIESTFADPRTCIVFRGVERKMAQQETADALGTRGLPLADQRRVSETLRELDKLGLVNRTPKGPYVTAGGLQEFGLERTIKATLRKHKISDIT